MTICPVCGARLAMQASAEACIARCPGCGVGVTVPPPTRDVTGSGLFEEGSYGGTRLKRRRQWIREAERRFDWIEGYGRPGSILEVGAATGEFLAVAARAGVRVTGIETSVWAADQARLFAPPARVFTGTLDDWVRSQQEMFDAVVMFHVLEHVDDPLELLRSSTDCIKSGGLVFIEVPNGAARDALEQGTSWSLAAPEDHFTHFTPEVLEGALRSVGLIPLRQELLSLREYDPWYVWLVRRLRWWIRGHHQVSEDLLRVVAEKPY